MQRQPVASSNIASVGYDGSQQVLEVAFHSGSVYQYRGVPPSLHAGLMQAASHGTYFERVIRRSFHGYRVG